MTVKFYSTLALELATDPLGRGYASMTDEEVAADLNIENRDVIDPIISSAMLFNSIDPTEYSTLMDTKLVDLLLGVGEGIDAGPGTNARTVIVSAFGGGSTTVANLVEAATKTVSRAVEIGLGQVKPGHVGDARHG